MESNSENIKINSDTVQYYLDLSKDSNYYHRTINQNNLISNYPDLKSSMFIYKNDFENFKEEMRQEIKTLNDRIETLENELLLKTI